MKNALCLLVNKPRAEWLDFLHKFVHYDIYICCEDSSVDYTHKYSQHYKNIHFIQLNNHLCAASGFKNSLVGLDKRNIDQVSVLDKALCYFAVLKKRHRNVWFIDDNTFFYNEDTLLNIDKKHPNEDYLSGYYYDNTVKSHEWYWPREKGGEYIVHDRNICLSPPFYKSMTSACRLSATALAVLKAYIYRVGSAFFSEVMITTLVKQHGLKYETPKELFTVTPHGWENWKYNDINKIQLYQPIDNIRRHIMLRESLEQCKK